MKSTITNAAEITILEPIDNNYKTGGGDISVGGALIVASKGKPFSPYAIYGGTSDLEDSFGTPLSEKLPGMEGLRHVHDAAEGCSYVNVIRVVNRLTYRFPATTFLIANDNGDAWTAGMQYVEGVVVSVDGVKYLCAYGNTSDNDNRPGTAGGEAFWLPYSGPTETSAHRYDDVISVGEGAFMVIYPVDGDTSVNRYVEISNVNEEKQRFTLTFYDKDKLGEEYLLESLTVGVNENDVDDMGLSAYIEKVFQRTSDYFRCDFNESYTWDDIFASLKGMETTRTVSHKFVFEGGKAGEEPDLDDWKEGLTLIDDEKIACNLLFAAGNYDQDFIVAAAAVADERHIAFFYDIPPGLKADEAIAWNRALSLTSRHSRAYYSPYSASDQWRDGKTVWGVSGAMAAAKARCNSVVTVGSVPGVHYAPAGEKRAFLTRTGLVPLFYGDKVNRDAFVEARINPVWPATNGGCAGDDDLTQWFFENYLRFGWINDVLDYIDHRFYQAARQMKFEPDGLTRVGLMDMTVAIMEDLVTSGALVAPRMPERDGVNPYVVTVEQIEIDLWKVTWEVCITGAARRIAGQPKLIK